jgi:hypothetical protein
MARKHTKSRRGSRKYKHKTQRRRGGGWSENLRDMLYPGGPEHKPYPGPGYDCAGVPTRPGYITNPAAHIPGRGGLPGMSGGACGSCAGATQLGSGGPVAQVMGGGKRRKTSKRRGGGHGGLGGFGETTGATSELNQLAPSPVMRGGRYTNDPGLGMLNPVNAVGASGYAPVGRVMCEAGIPNPLNPNPNNIQNMTTVELGTGVKGWAPWDPAMKGGGKRRKGKGKGKGRKVRRSQKKMRGGVYVGQVDSMRYYAPTAGYGVFPMNPVPVNNPGVTMEIGYPARHFNPACMKTN